MVSSKLHTQGHCGIDLKCEIIVTQVDGEENMGYTTYGVRVTNGDGTAIFEQPDISTSKSLVAGYIGLCEAGRVSALHLRDVLDDYLP